MSAGDEHVTDAAGGSKRAAVIFNPVKQGVEELRAIVTELEREHGFGPTHWIETTEDDPGTGQAREADARAPDRWAAHARSDDHRPAMLAPHGATWIWMVAASAEAT